MWGDDDCNRPSKRLNDVLTGAVSPKDAHDNVMQWAEFAVWQAACEVMNIDTRQGRIDALDKIPETLQPYVRREVKRMWALRV